MNYHTEAVLDYALIKRDLQAYAVTPMGQALVEQLHPLAEPSLLHGQLQETSELAALLMAGDVPPLAPIPDLSPLLATVQIEDFYLDGTQLLEIAACLEAFQRLRRYGQSDLRMAPLLSRRLAALADFGIPLRQLRHALDEQGQVRDHASPAVLQVRQTLRRGREQIHTRLRALMATHSAVVQDAIVTIRNGRFVIPVKTDFRPVLRGIVHGESASGATVYVEPDSVVELNNQLMHTQAEEERAVRAVLRELTALLAVHRVGLQQAWQIFGAVDFLCAKGQLSRRMQGIAPQFTDAVQLRLLAARHPFLTDPIPIDVHLEPSQTTLVITGPNTGGKTAVLKTVGLLVLMAQSGLHIPASPESVLPIFTEVFADLGDEQSLQQNLSTFSAHLANICLMMRQVSRRSLILLDELGAGTDPLEGGPLGVALLEYFRQQGAMTLATTHHGVIKAFAMSAPQVACAAVNFDVETLAPRYQLVYGLPGRSQAFTIAQKLGVPTTVIDRAQQEAGLTQLRSEQLLARLEVERHALEAERRQVQMERVELERLHSAAQHALARAQEEEQRVRQTLFSEGQALLKQARQELDATLGALRRQGTSTAVPFPQEAWQRLEQAVAAVQPAATAAVLPTLQVGEAVQVRGLKLVGRLRTPVVGDGPVQVEVGGKTITVAATELERSATPYTEPPLFPAPSTRQSRRSGEGREPLGTELRLLGYTVAEALPVVDKYLHQAIVQGLPRLRIVHGVGSGRLREAIGEFLGRHPSVRRFQAADANGGVTIVELEG